MHPLCSRLQRMGGKSVVAYIGFFDPPLWTLGVDVVDDADFSLIRVSGFHCFVFYRYLYRVKGHKHIHHVPARLPERCHIPVPPRFIPFLSCILNAEVRPAVLIPTTRWCSHCALVLFFITQSHQPAPEKRRNGQTHTFRIYPTEND